MPIFYALRKLLPYIFNALMGSMVNSHLPFEPSKERSFGHELIWYTRATHVLQRQLLQRTMKLDYGSSAGPCLDTMDWQALSPHAWSLLILETNETDKWAKKHALLSRGNCMEPTFFQGIESASQITVSNATGQDILRQCQFMCNTHCCMQLKVISSTC